MNKNMFDGLMKGIMNVLPEDNPEVGLLKLQTQVGDMEREEAELFEAIGRKVVEEKGAEAFGETGAALQQVLERKRAAVEKLQEAKAAKEAEEAARKMEDEERTCHQCSHYNAPGVKFCQECGAKLEKPQPATCPGCEAAVNPGVRFCGECGARVAD